jgi:hypothetical protein
VHTKPRTCFSGAQGSRILAACQDFRDDRGLKVFLPGIADEALRSIRGEDHRHALLGFGKGQLHPVKAGIFLGDTIQIHPETRCQFSHRYRKPSGAKVIAPFDKAAYLGITEEALQLPFFQGIAFLHFRSGTGHRCPMMGLGRTGGPSYTVPSGFTPHQEHQIPLFRFLPPHPSCGDRPHHGPQFHAFCKKPGMVPFAYLSCGKPYLVSIGSKALCGFPGQLDLGELPRKRLREPGPGIPASTDTHGLMYIGPPGEGIPNGSP